MDFRDALIDGRECRLRGQQRQINGVRAKRQSQGDAATDCDEFAPFHGSPD
jgi:hypothetical protein